jgi:transcriptional regulator with XRE-family HTH domain
VPRRPTSSSPFSLYCRALRTSRGLTQEQLADAAGVHVSSLKNAEGDNPISLSSIRTIYRDGIPGKKALSAEEWHQLIAYWLARDLGETISLPDLTGAIRKTDAAGAETTHRQHAALLSAVDALPTDDRQLLTDLAVTIAKTKKRQSFLQLIRSALHCVKG